MQVVTQFPGQAPEEVERSVTLPIEREMAGVPRMTQLRSVSITGLSVVTLTFSDNTDDYFVRQQVLEKLQNVTLPPNVQPQLAPLSTAVGEIYRYVIDAPADMPDYEVRALQDWVIRPELRIVPGIADVVSFGGSIKEYQVRLNPYALKKYGVTIDQVSAALSANSANAGGGLLRRGEEALVIRGIGLFQSLDDIGQVIVASRNGRTILVARSRRKRRRRAQAAVGHRRLQRPRFHRRGHRADDQGAERGQGGGATCRPRSAEVQAKLPKGVRIVPFYKRTDLIHHTVHTVTENLVVGALLVIGILIIFLRNWRAALIVACVIPLSLLVAFIMMDARGVSANLISLGAVDFGIIIDSAVVLVEALMVRLAVAQAEHNPAARRLRLAHAGPEAHGGRARPPDPVLQGDHHHRVPADLHVPAGRGKDLLAGRVHAVLRAARRDRAHHDPGADAALLHHEARQHGRDAQRVDAPPAAALSRAACLVRRAQQAGLRSVGRGACGDRSRWRRCSAASSCRNWTKATSGSRSRCRRRPRWSAPRRSSARCARSCAAIPR